jgi:hypothetical protein
MFGKEHIFKSMSAKDDLAASGKLINVVEDLVPAILRHEIDERVQTNNGLLFEMVENNRCEKIGIRIII